MPRFSMIPLFHQPIDLDRFNDLFESALRTAGRGQAQAYSDQRCWRASRARRLNSR